MLEVPLTLLAGSAVVAGGSVFCRAMFASRSCIFGPLTCRGPATDPPRVALTFDDGPDPDATPRILERLAQMDVPAAFCVIGANARRWPRVLEDVHAAGHLVVNHTLHHHRLGVMRRRRYWRDEVRETDELIASIIGRRPRLFRPPMGFKNWHLMAELREQGLVAVTWTRRGHDGVPTTTDRILRRLIGRPAAGDILAIHDGCEPGRRRPMDATIDAVAPLIEAYRQRGLEFARLDEVLGEAPYREPV